MYRYLFFDLDGTLTDSGEGIANAAAYALGRMGYEVPSREELFSFVGPPLTESFPMFGVPADRIDEAVRTFREYYNDRGWLENAPYPGVAQLCEKLRDSGYELIVATSKKHTMALQVMEHFGLSRYFTDIIGSDDDIGRSGKSEVIEYLLEQHGITDMSEVVMIGDRHYDVKGAARFGISTIGVAYGYGTRQELEEAGAAAVAESVEELGDMLLPGPH